MQGKKAFKPPKFTKFAPAEGNAERLDLVNLGVWGWVGVRLNGYSRGLYRRVKTRTEKGGQVPGSAA